jgi:hypothetical protein
MHLESKCLSITCFIKGLKLAYLTQCLLISLNISASWNKHCFFCFLWRMLHKRDMRRLCTQNIEIYNLYPFSVHVVIFKFITNSCTYVHELVMNLNWNLQFKCCKNIKKYANLIMAHDVGSEIQAYFSLIYEAQ